MESVRDKVRVRVRIELRIELGRGTDDKDRM